MTFHKYLADSKMFEYDKHYRESQHLDKPFIKAKINPAHQNYYHVQIDMITCSYNLTSKDQDMIKNLVQQEVIFLKSKPDISPLTFNIDKEIAWFDGISPERLDNFCISLYDQTSTSIKI